MARTHAFANDRLRLSLTDECNFTCPYCTNEGQGGGGGGRSFLSIDWLERLARKILREGVYVRKVNLTGGEPLLHNQLLEAVRICRGFCDAVTVNTNGSLLALETVDALMTAGTCSVKFGVDAVRGVPSKAGWRRGFPSASEVWAKLRYAQGRMPRTSANIVVSRFNRASVNEILDVVVRDRVDKVEFLELIVHDWTGNGGACERAAEVSAVVREFGAWFASVEYNRRLAKFICRTADGLLVQFAEDFCRRRVCGNLWTRVNAQGRFVPCIKKPGETYEIDMDQELAAQGRRVNLLMCSGPDGYVPRDSQGCWLKGGGTGSYEPTAGFSVGGQLVGSTDVDL